MPKTNHQRGSKDNSDTRTEYTILKVQQQCPDGTVVTATATNGDAVCGKHGVARSRRGAKKYVHSRRRRATRDWILKQDGSWEE